MRQTAMFRTRAAIMVVLFSGSAVLLSACASMDKKGIAKTANSKLKIAELLKSGNFSELERQIAEVWKRYESGKSSEITLSQYFSAFKRADPDIAGPLERWRRQHSNSFAPHLAFGLYSAKLGWVIGGGEVSALNNERRLKETTNQFGKAVPALRKAIQINPRLPDAWVTLMNIAKTRRQPRKVTEIFEDAVRYLPKSSYLYWTYYKAHGPKWVGYSGQRYSIRHRIKSKLYDDPDFGWIDTIADSEKAWRLVTNTDRDEEALKIFDKIIEQRPDAVSRSGRARALYYLRQFNSAIEEYWRVLAIDPGNPKTYVWIARMQELARRKDEALQTMGRALQFDPYHPRILIRRAEMFIHRGEFVKARIDLDKALVFGADDDEVSQILRQYYWATNDMAAAIKEAERAIALGPARPWNWYLYAITLRKDEDCRAIAAYEKYLSLCQRNQRCDASTQNGARASIYNMRDACS